MSCSALGSILKKLCDSCSCILGTLCNCSHHNQVMMMTHSDTPVSQELVNRALGEGDLQNALKLLHDHSTPCTPSSSKEILGAESESEMEGGTTEKVLRFAHEMFVLLDKQGNLSFKDKWGLLKLAASLAEMPPLNELQGLQLSKEQRKLLRFSCEEVQKHGSLAISCWLYCKEQELFSEEKLKRFISEGGISLRQEALLRDLFKRKTTEEIFNPSTFFELNFEIQKFFFEIAREKPIKHQFNVDQSSKESARNPKTGIPSSSFDASSEKAILEHLLDVLSDVGDAEISQDEKQLLGKLRLKLLCRKLQFSEDLYLLSEEQLRQIQLHAIDLYKYDAAVFYLFSRLKRSWLAKDLKENFGFTDDVVQACRKTLREAPFLQEGIENTDNLLNLSLDCLEQLYLIAKKIPESSKTPGELSVIGLQSLYRLQRWVLSDVTNSPPRIDFSPNSFRRSQIVNSGDYTHPKSRMGYRRTSLP